MLQTLTLSYNKLHSIPKELGQLAMLQELCLDHNQLQSIPEELRRLPMLHTFKLDAELKYLVMLDNGNKIIYI